MFLFHLQPKIKINDTNDINGDGTDSKDDQTGSIPVVLGTNPRTSNPLPSALSRAIDNLDVDAVRDLSSKFSVADITQALTRAVYTDVDVEAPEEIESKKEIIKILIEAGADVNVTDQEGQTALMQALYIIQERAKRRSEGFSNDEYFNVIEGLQIVEVMVIARADITATDKERTTALIELLQLGRYIVEQHPLIPSYIGILVEILVKIGADVNAVSAMEITDNIYYNRFRDETALMIAVQIGDLDIVKILLEKGADPNARDVSGSTALMFASRSGSLRAVGLLIDHGAMIFTNLLPDLTQRYFDKRG